MKTALFFGILIFFFLEIRSETNASQHSNSSELTVKTPVDVTLPPNTPSPTISDTKNETMSSSTDLIEKDKTRTVSEKPFAYSVSGTEKPTHGETFSIPTTASDSKVSSTQHAASTTEVKSSEEKSTVLTKPEPNQRSLLPKNTTLTTPTNTTIGFLPTLNKSTNITRATVTSVSPNTKPQSLENTVTTSLTTTTNKSTIINTMSIEKISTTSTGLPENIKATITSAITRRYNQTIQNITSGGFGQSSSTTAVTSPSATNGTALVIHVKTTEIHKNYNISTTTKPQATTANPTFSLISTTPAEISTTNLSETTNSTQGGWINVITKALPATHKPYSTEESTQKTESQPCSSIGVVKKCLIVIASLAVVATIFIISTIILCTKLSSRKHKLRRAQQGTELTCISSLLQERPTPQHRYTRQRSPVPNGVLVIHPFGDSDDDIEDNLTLSSFLPDNDRYV